MADKISTLDLTTTEDIDVASTSLQDLAASVSQGSIDVATVNKMDAALGNIGQALLDNHEPLDEEVVTNYLDSISTVTSMYG